jgi:hypothetical protein
MFFLQPKLAKLCVCVCVCGRPYLLWIFHSTDRYVIMINLLPITEMAVNSM